MSPEQIATRLPISQETLYQHVYSDKLQGAEFFGRTALAEAKENALRGWTGAAEVPYRRPLSERPLNIEARKQIVLWECDSVMFAKNKGVVVTMVKRKSGNAVVAKVPNKTSELVSLAIVINLKSFDIRVKTLTNDNGEEFAAHGLID